MSSFCKVAAEFDIPIGSIEIGMNLTENFPEFPLDWFKNYNQMCNARSSILDYVVSHPQQIEYRTSRRSIFYIEDHSRSLVIRTMRCRGPTNWKSTTNRKGDWGTWRRTGHKQLETFEMKREWNEDSHHKPGKFMWLVCNFSFLSIYIVHFTDAVLIGDYKPLGAYWKNYFNFPFNTINLIADDD